MRIGELTVDAVKDGMLTLDYRMMWPNKSESDFVRDGALVPLHDGMVSIDVGAFVVRSGERVILIDAGSGPALAPGEMAGASVEDPAPDLVDYLERSGRAGNAATSAIEVLASAVIEHGELMASLESLGVRPDDVTDVVLTHLHHDHVGWVAVDGTPMFPRAEYYCDERDADFFVGPDPTDEAIPRICWGAMSATVRLAPVLDRMKMWSDDTTIAPGVSILRTPGHTPGSSVVVLSSGTDRALLLGDVVHCPLEMLDDDWHALVDVDPVTAQRTRDALFREIDGDTVLGAPHFPGLEFGRVLPGEQVRRWVPMS
jgi:glyoxylase-like metal-dependent hydrolase (beta-lactamase superfamily II)